MSHTGLIHLFKLENDEEGFELATTPKSCGGGEEFKFLALIGDKIQDLSLIEIAKEAGVIDTGRIKKEFIEPFHNKVTLTSLGCFLKIDYLLDTKQRTNSIGKDDIKECIEALIGRSYQCHGFSVASKILKELFEICRKEELLFSNPLSRINELDPTLRSQFIIISENESGDRPHFVCVFEGEFGGKRYFIRSEKFEQKEEAEVECAIKFLIQIEGTK